MPENTFGDVSQRNDSATRRAETGNTRGICSGPVLYELIDDRGILRGHYRSSAEAINNMAPGWTVRPAGEFMHHRAAHGPVKVEG